MIDLSEELIVAIPVNTTGSVDSTVEINDSTANGPTLSNSDRFGVSVTSIGDLNNDGLDNDLAVGAHEDDNGGIIKVQCTFCFEFRWFS